MNGHYFGNFCSLEDERRRSLGHLIIDYVHLWFYIYIYIYQLINIDKLSMGVWGLDFPVSIVDLNQRIVTILLWYKVLQNHGILL